jgi:glycosyltransferase involved in cell wall biosynthesis
VVNGAPHDSPSTPRVTVVIPTYNYAEALAYAIASVLDQTLPDFELLVIGDGCTDDSEHVATATGDDRVQWINLPRRTGHQAGPNNEGLLRARADLVAYLGHDDVWLPNHLEVLTGAFDAATPAAHTIALGVCPGQPNSMRPEPGWSYTRGAFVPPTAMAIRRRVAVEIGGWRPPAKTGYLSPEADLLARVYDVAGPPRWVPRVTCIKLAAFERRNVYRTRPTHEQAGWLALIRQADDPERAITAQVGRLSDGAGYAPAPDGQIGDPALAPVGFHERVWRSARYRVRRRLGLPTGYSAKTQIRKAKRFKGAR